MASSKSPVPARWALGICLLAGCGSGDVATVEPPRVSVASVSITPSEQALSVGDSVRLDAVLRDAGNVVLTGRSVTWNSNAPLVATVSSGGVVTGIAPGSAVVSASAEGKAGTAIITVTTRVATVSVSPETTTLVAGGSQFLVATVKDPTGAVLADRIVSWTSSDSGIVGISSHGFASANAPGTAVITAASDGKSGTAMVAVTGRPGYTGGQTVVIRVVGTGPGWGQEPKPGWPNAAPVKEDTDYALYDLEIGRDNAGKPTYVAVYRFRNWSPSLFALSAAEFARYLQASTIYRAAIPPGAGSSAVLDVLKNAVAGVLQEAPPRRLVLSYSGHGGPTVFFEGALSMSDARALVRFARDLAPTAPIILDFSTNCNVGYVDFASYFHDTAEFLIASEKVVGGFDVSDVDINVYLSLLHDNNLHTFWRASNPAASALDDIVAMRRGLWDAARAGLVRDRVEQSLAVYDLSQLNHFMNVLAATSGFDPHVDIPAHSQDIGAFVYSAGDANLIAAFEHFRVRYVSNRDLVTWVDDTRGFAVQSTAVLANLLAGR